MDSGHMDPMDILDVALEVMQIFMYGSFFRGNKSANIKTKNKNQNPIEKLTCITFLDIFI